MRMRASVRRIGTLTVTGAKRRSRVARASSAALTANTRQNSGRRGTGRFKVALEFYRAAEVAATPAHGRCRDLQTRAMPE
jgi:hypothetical protein